MEKPAPADRGSEVRVNWSSKAVMGVFRGCHLPGREVLGLCHTPCGHNSDQLVEIRIIRHNGTVQGFRKHLGCIHLEFKAPGLRSLQKAVNRLLRNTPCLVVFMCKSTKRKVIYHVQLSSRPKHTVAFPKEGQMRFAMRFAGKRRSRISLQHSVQPTTK
jgi:hypothetical protein